jgi:alanine racemase
MTVCSKKGHRCWAVVELEALRENLAWIRHRIGPGVKIITVVKADAYGHGLKPIAALLMQSGTDVFGVANLAEAQAIRAVGRGWPILMLGACLPDEVEWAVRDAVMPSLSSLEEARRFSAAAVKFKKNARVHLKVDTGMGRLGVPADQAGELLEQVRRLPQLELQGLYTHFASVEDDPDFSRQQTEAFQRLLAEAAARQITIPLVHSNNSGALLFETLPDGRGSVEWQHHFHNAVRPGLLVYGILPPGRRQVSEAWKNHVRPALSWKCRVSLVKAIPAGKPLSYGCTFVSPKPMRVATLTAGYGDGYLRAGSNRACVLIGGQRCPILGRITMDQMLADVSAVPAVAAGDEAVLIGRQGSQQITATELADWFGTIPWEVLTTITYRVPRLYQGSQAA